MLLRFQQVNLLTKFAYFIAVLAIIVLTIIALPKYAGHKGIYLLFTVVCNTLLYAGFSKNAIFFDAFIGVFFWLGFWLKLTLRVAFSDGLFNEAIGNFDGSGVAFDRALLVATCGLCGLLLVSLIRRQFFFNYPKEIKSVGHINLFEVYKSYRKTVLSLFVFLFIFIAISNAMLGIYQKGSITQTTLPFGFNGVYKWLLLFGLTSFSALILRFEFEINKKTTYLVMFLSLFESFITNVSLLSRGMILNTGALLYGLLISLKLNSIKSKLRFFITTFIIFSTLFISSVLLVNYLRTTVYIDQLSALDSTEDLLNKSRLQATHNMTTPLFIDRWVGMEGVMAVSSYTSLGWSLWSSALKETYNENEFSFYDQLIQSNYVEVDKYKHHFISLPGVIAFFFYPGSFLFLFVGMFALGGFAAMIEFSTYKLGGMNVILCALLAQVVAYRFASFGYVPAQSYLLLGSLFLNLFIIYFAEKLVALYRKRVKS